MWTLSISQSLTNYWIDSLATTIAHQQKIVVLVYLSVNVFCDDLTLNLGWINVEFSQLGSLIDLERCPLEMILGSNQRVLSQFWHYLFCGVHRERVKLSCTLFNLTSSLEKMYDTKTLWYPSRIIHLICNISE